MLDAEQVEQATVGPLHGCFLHARLARREPESAMMHASTTVFTVKDVMASLAYFRDKLGFDVAFEYGNPTFYVGLCSGQVTLHLVAAAQTPRMPGHGAVSIF